MGSVLMQVIVKSEFMAARDGFLDASIAPQLFHGISYLGIGESYVGVDISLSLQKHLAQWLKNF